MDNNDHQIYYQHFTKAFSTEDLDKIIAPRRKKTTSSVLPSGTTEPVLAPTTLRASVLNPANVNSETCQLTIMVVTESHTSTNTYDMLYIYMYVQIMAHCTKAVLRRQVKVKVTYPPASSAQSCGRSPSCLCPAHVSTAARTAGCWRSETGPQPSAEIYAHGCMVKCWTQSQTFSQTRLHSNPKTNAV